jgi:hypothetical protein
MNPVLPLLLALVVPALAAQPVCDKVEAQPMALFERFTSADCAACWQDAATPAPGPQALVLDWIVPGRLEDEAPLSAAATRDALHRLQALGRATPATTDVHTAPVEPAPGLRLRVGHGPAVNDYLGATATVTARQPAADWTLHLLVVESLPAGPEAGPVTRNVVRNMLYRTLDKQSSLSKLNKTEWQELRPMRIPEGAQPERLRTVGWVQDPRGRVLAAAQSACQ